MHMCNVKAKAGIAVISASRFGGAGLQYVLKGVNVAVAGLLLTALYTGLDERDPFTRRLRS